MWLTNLHFSGHGQLGLSQLVWMGLVATKQGLKFCLTNSLLKSSYFLSCALCFDSWFQTLRLMFVFGFVWIGPDYTPQVPTFSNVFDLLWLFLHHCFCFVWMGFNLFFFQVQTNWNQSKVSFGFIGSLSLLCHVGCPRCDDSSWGQYQCQKQYQCDDSWWG